MSPTLRVRARISLADDVLADQTFTIDPTNTTTPWMDVLAGLIDIGRAARDTQRQELAMVTDQ